MFFWNSLAFSMIQRMLAIWSLVPLPFLKPAWTSETSRFRYCWSLAWRILSTTFVWRRKWQPTPVFLPGKSHGWKSLVGYSSWGHKESNTTKWLHLLACEMSAIVVWTFFGVAFLRNWNENWPFPVLWPLMSFPNLLAYWVQHFHSIIFQDLK